MGILHRLIAAAALCLWAGTAAAECRPDRVDIRGEFGTVRFRVELALTPEDQSRGLMFREEMARMSGMLFVYPQTREVGFWMRNTLIPLDMIFVDEAGRVVKVHADAVPLDETVIRSGAPTRGVLELNAGMAATLGIDVGDELRSPVMPQDGAAWPCAE
ncbi:DUF192 domain-containing protein [Jannaschia sp. KMU-145]|uniref:DUF192 domain-containing protein n=1 Tax=Jannaschia halovivens TaxID=3388667 RepID=UPI00396B0D2F